MKKTRGTGPSGGIIVMLMVLTIFAILAIAAFNVAEKNKKENGQKRPSEISASAGPEQKPTGGTFVTETGEMSRQRVIMEEIDAQEMEVGVCDTQTGEKFRFRYSSATTVRDRYGKELVMEQLLPGDVVEVSYEASGRYLKSVSVPEDLWEYAYQSGVLFLTDKNMIAMGSQAFRYTDCLHVYSNGGLIRPEDIAESDTVTLSGAGNEVYVIRLNRGHGYLSFREYEDFFGGSLLLNGAYKAQVTEGMRLTLPEGRYQVTVEHQELKAELTANIRRGEETTLDLTDYVRVADPSGTVQFKIQPEGALLWIDREQIYYTEPVTLKYGEHSIRVEAGGYVPYNGTFELKEAARVISVSLSEAPVTEPDVDQTYGDTHKQEEEPELPEKNGEDTPGDNTSEYPQEDKEYRAECHIVIYSDDDVEVYLDGEFVGMTENGRCELEKKTGSFTLELVKGTETKSYRIQVDDDGEDFIFRRYFE